MYSAYPSGYAPYTGRWEALLPCSTRTMKTLDQEFEDHLAKPADKLNFQVYERDWNVNHWSGSIKLRNQQLRIELYCERGLINLNISPLTGQENFIDAELINSYLTPPMAQASACASSHTVREMMFRKH